MHRSLVLSALSKYLNMGITLASVVIFSRLLTPDELGIHVVAVAIAALAIEVRLLGTGGYLIRKEVITPEDCQRVIGVTMAISFPLGAIMFATSGWVGSMFETKGVDTILAILSLGFLTAPFISVSRSVLSKNFRFDILMVNNVLSTLVTFLASLCAFFLGAGYTCLAIGLVVGQFSKLFFFLFVNSPEISWKPSLKGAREVFRFGLFVAQASLLRKLAETSPEIIIGKLGNPALAAIFSRSVGLYKFFFDSVNSAVQPVVMPYLAKAKKNKTDLSSSYLNAVTHLSILIIPILCVLSIVAKPAILLMFGEQWLESVEFVPVLCFWGILKSLYCWANTMLVTAGFEKSNYYRQIAITFSTVLLCYLAYSHGLIYVAWALVATACIDNILLGMALRKHCNVRFREVLKSHSKSFIVGGACGLATLLLDSMLNFEQLQPLVVLLILTVTIPVIWLGTVIALGHSIADIPLALLGRIYKRSKA